ncbi:secretin N-terminal domain-containing protein [Deinococcus sp. MIMF12]|uniref:Secretin N-terminal domain-containing protein n=1 Tax=Deinococcus rhizophilus TaxID=3049544 RepID=A0ABT7JGC9_9DEIO|nr:secretin N-terminal domain-containing protein [Deinococcus rhizophilus]MDL2344115.1 secretin N-terminal domain-containing protein [Deinococcus rhizophilus]
MKRYALLLTAALGMAAAQPSAPVPAAPLTGTADRQLSGAAVTFDLRRAGSDLTSMLLALAKSAGYEILLEPGVEGVLQASSAGGTGAAAGGAVPALVTYSVVNKPFNEVWPLVLDLYGLSYETLQIGGRPVLRVTARPVQKIVRLPETLSAPLVERQLKLSFGTLKSVSTSQSSGAQGSSSGTTETSREEIVLDSPTLRIIAEPSSNSVIVRGTNQEVAQVERLLAEIVAAQPANVRAAPVEPPTVQRIYTVKGAAADATALLTAQFPELRATPVGQTGQIVITGPQNRLEAALTLLGQVDRAPAPVTPTPAEAPTAQRVYAVKGQQADLVTLLGAQFSTLKVTPVGQTGQLVITGPQTQLDAALALLGQVDRAAPPAQTGPQIVQRVFTLINASAEEVKATLEGTLAREVTPVTRPASLPVTTNDVNGNPVTLPAPAQGAAGGGQSTAQATATADLVTLIADRRTNTLIVRGTPSQVAQVAELVPQLDQVVPQINVQVRIQEINETAARTLGMDWKVNFGGFNVNVGGSGLGATFDPTRSLVGFNIFPTLQALETQGFTKRVYDGNISMQSGQRSLGNSTTSQNASANAAASIKSGGRLEINIPSNSGNIEKQIDYGLNLDFFDPQVAPDGTITLRVRGQVNNIAGALPTTELPNLLNFTNSEAQSTITFKNGQTVLMSGLLGTTETRSTNGVPLLSSIPIIGAAFSQQRTDRNQTQLLVIITGTVVK